MLRTSTFCIVALFLASCIPAERDASILSSLERDAEAIRQQTVPERRTGVFNFVKDDDGHLAAFETDNGEAAARVDSLLQSYGYDIPVQMLPQPELGDTVHAVVRVAVANLRREPRHGAEMVDQTIMGTPLKILKIQGGWAYIQTPHLYLGWMTLDSATPMDRSEFEAWSALPKARISAVESAVHEKQDPNSLKLAGLSMNSQLALVGSRGAWTEVQLPDGRLGFVPTSDLGQPVAFSEKAPEGWEIVKTATQFHGIPYLWGGNSSSGLDCSGFTQTVYAANGFQLPRDANMQVKLGDGIPIDSTFAEVLPGDLLFFGNSSDRITHVGISMGGGRFIHASTFVMMNSLIPGDPDYSDYRRRTLQFIKRLPSTSSNL